MTTLEIMYQIVVRDRNALAVENSALVDQTTALQREVATQAETIRNWAVGWADRHTRDVEVNRELDRLRKDLAECEKKAASSEAMDRYIASGVGGAMLGASGFGPPGAIVGAIIGIALASNIKRRLGRTNETSTNRSMRTHPK